ncbi:oxidoreductase [Kurthia sibirica]|uniref:Oxidoreductase n=1 Tax=Kurthia sibirica TaxID=202750 RepID=A0A2U3AQA4_9BACL|nr:oxidoreductase [Kurthia sibirica]
MKIERIVQESPTIKRFRFIPTEDELLPAFTGGAHLKTFLQADDELFERDYSLISDPRNRQFYEIAISKDSNSRGGSKYWHEQIVEGDELEISFPRNYFTLNVHAKHHVFYASGIGITPFLSMLQDNQFNQTMELHYAARTPEECAFYEVLKDKYSDIITFHFSRVTEPNRLSYEHMKTNRIGSHVYFCGPVSMVEEFQDAAFSYGYPEHAIHFELFSNGLDNSNLKAFTVSLTESGKEIQVSDKESLLDVLLREGINAPYACKIGGCGSCEVEVLNGEVEHRDHFLSEDNKQERKTILTCCSRAKEENLTIKL